MGLLGLWLRPLNGAHAEGLNASIRTLSPQSETAFDLIAGFVLSACLLAVLWLAWWAWRRSGRLRWTTAVRWSVAGAAVALAVAFALGLGGPTWQMLTAGLMALAPLLLAVPLLAIGTFNSSGGSPVSAGMFGREDSLINRLAIAVLVVDPSGRIVDINETAALWCGMARQGLIGRPVFEFNRQIGRILLESRRGVALDQDLNLDELSPPRLCHLHLTEEPWKGDQFLRLITLEDNSRFIKETVDLRRDRGLLEAALEGHHSGLMVTDPHGRVILRTSNLLRAFNLPERAFDTGLLGWRNQMAQVMKDPARFHRFLDQTIQQANGETLEMLEMANARWLECRSHTVVLPGGNVQYRIWSFTDYTDQARREQELLHLSTHDILTGANNRAFFENELRRLRLDRRYPISLIVTDVDGLKSINDQHGHPMGDEILRQAADILRRACRSDDIVARVGGDEFCVLLKHAESQAAEHVVDRIISLENLYNIRQPGPELSLSIGYAVATNPAELDTLFQRADSVMYAARFRKRTTNHR